MRFLFRLDAARRFLFRTVSQIGVNYRDSPLSEGGRLRPGRRSPAVGRDGAARGNLRSVTAMAWQVHVYGEPPRGVPEAVPGSGCLSTRSPGRPRWDVRVPGGALSFAGRVYRTGRSSTTSGAIGPRFRSRGIPAAVRRDEATKNCG